ncbi:MAG: hypothetical protein IPI13_08535 [Actinomycetales bacterium]|uniref:Uncharacterized protein n=1 Tax=Candidatus Phosphoribacter hodrii TaxID=2953743 RepID=A0A935M5E4_9MICO|nr:hypothetical protein [Candidatus Phosphoribacter hodrii]
MAYAVAQRADCTRRRVGAVVFGWGHRILATGSTGASRSRSVAWRGRFVRPGRWPL